MKFMKESGQRRCRTLEGNENKHVPKYSIADFLLMCFPLIEMKT